MKPHAHHQAILTLAIAITLLASPAATASMSTSAFEQTLADMQANVDRASQRYAEGDREGSLAAARAVAEHFTFDEAGASEVESKIKELSAIAIGDKVKAYAAKLVAAIEASASVEDVQAIADELAPSLNRLVLVAQGKTSAASQRQLKSGEEIDDAVAGVEKIVDRAVLLHKRGLTTQAVEAAKDAFFTFEITLGGDTEAVDKTLEDRTENLIVNFDATTVESDPGLSQLIENKASLEAVEAQAARIKEALGEVRDLLKATLPPLNLGDANGDGRVTIVDALFVAQAALGIRPQTDAMDVNRDGRVTIVDALFVAQAALGIRSL